MRRLELAVGLGLLLGPLVYALTLDAPPARECVAKIAVPAPTVVTETVTETVPATVVVERCDPPASGPKGPALRELMLVGDAGLVLTTDAEREWGTGRFFEPPGTAQHRVAKRANPDAIPTELWSLRGRVFDLYGPDGKVCTARLGELSVVAQYGWGLGGVLGDDWYDEDEEGVSEKRIREGLWNRDDLWLVAAIESRDSCKGALWARDAELPPAKILHHSDAPNRISIERREAFEKSELRAEFERNYRAVYADYAARDPEVLEWVQTWEQLVAAHDTSVWSWIDDQGRPEFIGLQFGTQPEGCGDELFAWEASLEQVRGDELVAVGESHDPVAIFDADGDGQYERLYSDFIDAGLTVISATFDDALIVQEDWGCPC